MANDRQIYSFKSAGNLSATVNSSAVVKTLPPIGFKTPIEISNDANAPFVMHTNIAQQIKDNFRNMLQTNNGARLMIGDFGANLEELSFEFGNENFDAIALQRISATTNKYMPFISLQTFEPVPVKNDDGVSGRAGFRVGYDVPSLGLSNQSVDVVIFIAG